jgi:hypothetical protein
MALLEDTLGGWGSTVLIGLGIALAAPILLPAAGAIVRPVAKGLIKGSLFVADSLREGSLFVADSLREMVAEGGEQVSDLVAEARAEYYGTAGTPSV